MFTPNYHVACGLQRKVLAAMEQKGLAPKDLCGLVAAWEKLEERKRILRMKGLPKAVDVSQKPKPVKRETFQE